MSFQVTNTLSITRIQVTNPIRVILSKLRFSVRIIQKIWIKWTFSIKNRYKKPGDPGRIFPNLLAAELNIDGPLQCIVSDMTAFYVNGIYYELTLYMDLWNNEIVSHAMSAKRGDRMTYISGLKDLLELKKAHPEYKMILHSDQGSVYASKAYNELLPMYVNRSMSRAGTPTDNAAMESINGWIKAELFMDLHVTGKNQ